MRRDIPLKVRVKRDYDQARYRTRRMREQCPSCAAPRRAAGVYCQRCTDTKRPESRLYAREAAAARREAPGPNLLGCCGLWHTVTHLPLRVVCCGRVFFAEVSGGT